MKAATKIVIKIMTTNGANSTIGTKGQAWMG